MGGRGRRGREKEGGEWKGKKEREGKKRVKKGKGRGHAPKYFGEEPPLLTDMRSGESRSAQLNPLMLRWAGSCRVIFRRYCRLRDYRELESAPVQSAQYRCTIFSCRLRAVD